MPDVHMEIERLEAVVRHTIRHPSAPKPHASAAHVYFNLIAIEYTCGGLVLWCRTRPAGALAAAAHELPARRCAAHRARDAGAAGGRGGGRAEDHIWPQLSGRLLGW